MRPAAKPLGATIASVCVTGADVFPVTDPRLNGLTPADLFLARDDTSNVFWLDNAAPDAAGEQWSYLGNGPVERFELHASQTLVQPASVNSPSAIGNHFQAFLSTLSTPDCAGDAQPGPPFRGGWVGYIGYDAFAADTCTPAPRSCAFPLASFRLFDAVIAFSHTDRQWWGAVLRYATNNRNARAAARRKMSRLLDQFAPVQKAASSSSAAPRLVRANLAKQHYVAAVERVLGYIAAGDIYQLNLSQLFTVPWQLPPQFLYARLREQSPAAYGAFLNCGAGRTLCSISPELFLRVRGRDVLTRPIKGTRPRGADAAADAAARRELETSPKERAELNMIVDLERNDLGRVCEYGSVRVVSPGDVEELPTLFHRVATIAGTLRAACTTRDLLDATFPGGSITGAPKIRAMQIIRELEPAPRGPYCGAIGWIGADGNMELSIAIRTALHDATLGEACYHAGSGIVADSIPEQEYEETLHKAAAFFRATNATLETQ
jgi:aminodeoxychorismate synthase component I